jgi:rhodanese-related sulfurtransferase
MATFARETGGLVAAALLVAAISNYCARPERRLAWLGSHVNGLAPPAVSTTASPGSPSGETPAARPWKEITPQETHAFHEARAIFFDARRSSAYREGHIPGARSISVWEDGIDQKIQQFYEEGHLPDTILVVYCSGGDCEDSHLLAERLWGLGFNRVVVYKDGFPDWKARGWPISTGGSP